MAIVQLVYDKETGAVIHRHSAYNVEEETYQEADPEAVMALALEERDIALSRVTGGDEANLAVLTLHDVAPEATIDVLVDPRKEELVPRPRLRLSAERTELKGDGRDAVTIEIELVDHEGAPVEEAMTVKVATTRGKLSAPGGVVELEGGAGEIRLTTVKETVAAVGVTATCPSGTCARAALDLEFL